MSLFYEILCNAFRSLSPPSESTVWTHTAPAQRSLLHITSKSLVSVAEFEYMSDVRLSRLSHNQLTRSTTSLWSQEPSKERHWGTPMTWPRHSHFRNIWAGAPAFFSPAALRIGRASRHQNGQIDIWHLTSDCTLIDEFNKQENWHLHKIWNLTFNWTKWQKLHELTKLALAQNCQHTDNKNANWQKWNLKQFGIHKSNCMLSTPSNRKHLPTPISLEKLTLEPLLGLPISTQLLQATCF